VTTSERHLRQTGLSVVGAAGQEALRGSTVLVAGCGALGTVAAELLARAGVGTLVIVDRDLVEYSNLSRQTLYGEQDASRSTPKAEAARTRLGRIDPGIRVRAFVEDLSSTTVESLVEGVDLIVDGLDNFETRYLLNDVAIKNAIPYLYGGAVGTRGMTMPVLARGGSGESARIRWSADEATPCLRCLFPSPPAAGAVETCDSVGVLGTVTSHVASRQATEAVKLLVGDLANLDRSLWSIDAWTNQLSRLQLHLDDHDACACCGERRFDFLEAPADRIRILCGRNGVQILGDGRPVDLDRVLERLRPAGRFEVNSGVIHGVLEDARTPDGGAVTLTIFPDGRSVVEGDADPAWARGILSRFVGI